MDISSDILERVRLALDDSSAEFCEKLGVSINDYSTFVSAEDLRNFPPKVMNKLTNIMLDMEQKNLEELRDKIPVRTEGYFSSQKIFQHMDKLAIFQSSPKDVGPITVEFRPSNRCNHRCPACTFGIGERKGGLGNAVFSTKLLPKLIADLQYLEVRGIDISGGGEPLMHPKLPEILSSFRSGGFDVGLVTNGTLLHSVDGREEKRCKAIRQSILENCTWCRISVDAGSQGVYKKMHGPAVDFSHLVNAIKLLAEEKSQDNYKMTLGVSFLLTPDNFLDLIKSVCIFRDLRGIDYFQIKPIVIAPVDRISKPNMIFWDRRIFDALITVKAYETRTFKIFTLGFKFIDMLLTEDEGLPFSKCWGHPFYPTVAADGTVLVCCHMLNDLFDGRDIGAYGKLTTRRAFLQIWKNKDRIKVASRINTRLCPSNCKLSETNKILEGFMGKRVAHKNFIN
jgi:wyosine [tRNA(Phe)-imidazoG37] synthetase (radical SAM superfamily)